MNNIKILFHLLPLAERLKSIPLNMLILFSYFCFIIIHFENLNSDYMLCWLHTICILVSGYIYIIFAACARANC